MGQLPNIIAALQAEEESRERNRYFREETNAERMRVDLETGDRDQWLQDTLDTENLLD